MFCHFRIASGTAQNGNTSAIKIISQEIAKLLPEVYLAPMLAGNWFKMHWQCFRMFSHLRIASGTAQNGNTSAIKIMGQEIVKLLPEMYFATMLAWSKMRRQSFRTFSHCRIASGMAQNGNTSATKIMCQEIMKTLPEVYFATMLAGNSSKMHRQCFRMFSHLRIASGMAQNGNTTATKTTGQEIVKLLPEVYLAPMLAGNWSKMRRQSFRTFCHFRIASGTAQNGNTSAIKIIGQEIMKLLPENYPKCVGSVSECFPTSRLHPAWPKMAIHWPQKSCVKKSWKCCRKCILQQCLPEHYPKCISSLSKCFPTSRLHPAQPKMAIHRPQK